MKLSSKQLLKYFYFSLIILWILMSMHILYLYTIDISGKKPVKGGTLVEGTFEKISYIPYLSNKNSDRFYKSMLFNSCLEPNIDGTKIVFKNNLCDVSTNDNKNYNIVINEGHFWSDGNPISIEDVYYTYNEVIKNNIREIPHLDKYTNINISLTGEILSINFALPSIDNQIFFTNYILPKHIVEGISRENYIEKFSSNPVRSNCANINLNHNDSNSFLFDLSDCDDKYIKYYQVKTFNDLENFKKYTLNNQFIDIYNHDITLTGFTANKIILNKFIGLFFNTNSELLNIEMRKSLTNLFQNNIYTGNYNNYFIKDKFLFDGEVKGKEIGNIIKEIENNQGKKQLVEKEIEFLPKNIVIPQNVDKIYEKQYYSPKINKEGRLTVIFTGDYEQATVSHNGKGEYVLKSYKKGSNTINYKLAENLKTIQEGLNTYSVKVKKGSESKEILKLSLYYIKKPTQEIVTEIKDIKFSFIYYEDEINNFIVENIKKILINKGIEKYFEFTGFLSIEEFIGKLSNQDYDIVLRGIDMGLKRDISTLFQINNNPDINPSLYKNIDLASLINQFFISEESLQKKIKNEIDAIYTKEIPFILFGKIYGKINIRNGLEYNYPERLYDLWFRKDYLNDLILSYKPYIEKEKLLDIKNFVEFIKKGLEFSKNNK